MSKLFKRTAISVLCVILLACAVAVGTIFGLNSRANKITGIAGGNGGHSAVAGSVTITPDSFDKEYDMDGADCDAQAAIWTEAVTYSKNNGKTVRVNLISDWIAKNTNSYKSFGMGDCFSSGSTGNTYEGSIFVPLGANIIINLNGHTIDRNCQQTSTVSYGGVIWVEGTLEVRDDSFLYDSNGYDKGVIKGGLVGNGGAIGVGAGAKLTINGGTFTGNTATNTGGAIWGGANSEIVINYGCFVDNAASSIGGAICTNSRLIINDGYFKNNSQTNTTSPPALGAGGSGLYGGGALGISVTATLTVNGGLFDGNSAQCFGGCILFFGSGTINSTVTINGGTFTNNTALNANCGNGGVLYCDGPATLNINGGIFNNNRATYYGGVLSTYGVLNNLLPVVNISGGEFFSNQANAGSVIFINQATFNMSGGYMHDNIASVVPQTNSCASAAVFLFGCSPSNNS
ncbi:MAG: hypothetical protein K2N33_05965, partial [Clostridia bacterium]|nr:hypothetical protein [Clostridia bacterium]